MKRGAGRVSTTVAPGNAHFLPTEKCTLRREGDPEKRCSFHFDHATPPDPMGFASQKRTLAFYKSKQNAPIGVNPVQWAISGKVCKSVLFFAHSAGKEVSGRVIRAFIRAGF
jgi:hypothetical protein